MSAVPVMMTRLLGDDLWYGKLPVILTREVGLEMQVLIGTAAPFGYIMVDEFEGEHYVEKSRQFWELMGFRVCEPEVMQEVRAAHQAHYAKQQSRVQREDSLTVHASWAGRDS